MLKIEQLDVKERSGRYLLKDISMEIPAGHVIGLTGKSGSGRTTLLRSILGMLHTSCHIDAGKILLDDIDLSHLSRKSHRELCGKKLGFIPQNPMTAFDSRLKIGYQMQETFVNRLHLNTSEATDLAKEKLFSVNKTNFFFSKENICKEADLKMVTPNPAKVFDNNSRYLSVLYAGNKFIPCRTVKGRSRPTIICVVVQIDKPMLFCIGFKHLLLMNNAIAVTVSVIIARKPLI